MRSINSSSGHDDRNVQAGRLPLRIRTAADVETLKANARSLRRLPCAGVEIRIPGLNPVHSRRLERRIRAYIRACGCAEGAAAALIGATLAIAFVTIQVWTRGPQWSDLASLAMGLFLALLAGGLGRLLGITIARLRFEHCCRRVTGSLGADRAARSGRAIA